MKSMSEEKLEVSSKKGNLLINDLLMKPFALGWTREVVRRVVTHNRTPSCDIYYFSPDKKRLRSLIEVKSNLTDGLSPECFSFKRQPLGLSPDLEIIRDAKVRGKIAKNFSKQRRIPNELKRPIENETLEGKVENNESEAKKKKTEIKEEEEKAKLESEIVESKDKLVVIKKDNAEIKKEFEAKPRRAKAVEKHPDESKNFNSNRKTKTKAKPAKPTKPTKPTRLQSVKKRKRVLKSVVNAKQTKQAKVVSNRKLVKKIVSKKVASPTRKLSKSQKDKKNVLKSVKSSVKLKSGKKPLKNGLAKTKTEVSKEPEADETGKKSTTKDLKSIVQKNIGKYREMREKQKLENKTQARSTSRKVAVAHVSRSRSEPICKNKPFYLKPLEKGWRRELVYRTNCAKAGQQADVYYFHPGGKKLRSTREIAENLTHGLSIECFTFRKEPIGCGEPSEIIRNARSHQRN